MFRVSLLKGLYWGPAILGNYHIKIEILSFSLPCLKAQRSRRAQGSGFDFDKQ